jgi:hypothetical protein
MVPIVLYRYQRGPYQKIEKRKERDDNGEDADHAQLKVADGEYKGRDRQRNHELE